MAHILLSQFAVPRQRVWAGQAAAREALGAPQGMSKVRRTQCGQGFFRAPSSVRPHQRSHVMPQMGRSGTRTVLLATALAMGLSLTLAFGVWASTGASTRSQVGLPRPSSTGIGAEEVPTGTGGTPGSGPASPALADQLHTMDATSVDRYAASEEAAARGGPNPSAAAKGTWLIGKVGTYLVGRGVAPGTYESAGASAGKTCRWGVTGTDSHTLKSGSSSKRTVVTIDKTAGFFQTQDCSNWHKIS